MCMGRAKHPEAYQLSVGLNRQGWRPGDAWDVKFKRVVSRIYDRSTGNFKAVGWIVEIGYYEVDPQSPRLVIPLQRIQVPLLDEFMPNYVQTTL